MEQDYRWMTKVAIHLMNDVDSFIVQYHIPEKDIEKVKIFWNQALEDWKNFEEYANTKKEASVEKQISPYEVIEEKTPLVKEAEPVVEEVAKEEPRYRNQKILNRLHQFNFQEEEEEDLINKYIDELNYQKVKKLSDLISFYGEDEEEEFSLSQNLSIA